MSGLHATIPTRAALSAVALLLLLPVAAWAQHSIRVGQTVSGTLTAADPTYDDSHYALWEFAGSAGDRVRIVLRSTDFDAYLWFGRLTADDCTAYCRSDDDGDSGTDARLEVTLPADGTYQIRAGTLYAGETGGYTLSLEALEPVPPAVPRPIRLGETVEGSLNDGSAMLDDGQYYDLFTYQARRGETLSFTLRSEEFDAYLYVGSLHNGEWRPLASDDDSGGNLDAALELEVEADALLGIRATSFSEGQTGAYQLSLERAVPARPVAEVTRDVRVGQTVTGTLAPEDPRSNGVRYHHWVVRGEPGASVVITMRSEEFDAFLEWGRHNEPEWHAIMSDDDGGGGVNGTDARLEVTLGRSGEFAARARSWRGSTYGSYTLTVESR